MHKPAQITLTVLGASLLAACAGAPVVQPADITGTYSPRVLEYIAGRGGMLTEVVGNPFRVPKEEVDAVVIETMARSHFGAKFPFFTEAPEDFASPYRVVVVLDPAPGTSAYTLCAGGAETRPRKPAEPNRVAAAFCAREIVITATSGSIAGPTGPRDPGFVRLIAQISLALFPPIDQERQSLEELMS
ncbi:MAG: hypothetical protein ACE5GS_16425 [Kiloniellaceae bacterium]